MRGLTLWQPMAWAIAEGHKPVENRPWALPDNMIDEVFAVHAGKRYDEPWAEMIRDKMGLPVPTEEQIDQGAIVAVATFAGCVNTSEIDALDEEDLLVRHMDPVLIDAVYQWFSGPYGFLLRDVHKLDEPIPCRGRQKLWTLPPEIERAVLLQLPSAPERPSSPTPVNTRQLTLIDPVAAERERIIGIIRHRAERWRGNSTPASKLVASAFEHVIAELDP